MTWHALSVFLVHCIDLWYDRWGVQSNWSIQLFAGGGLLFSSLLVLRTGDTACWCLTLCNPCVLSEQNVEVSRMPEEALLTVPAHQWPRFLLLLLLPFPPLHTHKHRHHKRTLWTPHPSTALLSPCRPYWPTPALSLSHTLTTPLHPTYNSPLSPSCPFWTDSRLSLTSLLHHHPSVPFTTPILPQSQPQLLYRQKPPGHSDATLKLWSLSWDQGTLIWFYRLSFLLVSFYLFITRV